MTTMMDDDDDDDDDDGRPTCLHYERNVRNIVSLLSVICDFPQGRPYPKKIGHANFFTDRQTMQIVLEFLFDFQSIKATSRNVKQILRTLW